MKSSSTSFRCRLYDGRKRGEKLPVWWPLLPYKKYVTGHTRAYLSLSVLPFLLFSTTFDRTLVTVTAAPAAIERPPAGIGCGGRLRDRASIPKLYMFRIYPFFPLLFRIIYGAQRWRWYHDKGKEESLLHLCRQIGVRRGRNCLIKMAGKKRNEIQPKRQKAPPCLPLLPG